MLALCGYRVRAMAMGDGGRRRIAGRYELQVTLGEGGMGVVWLAEDSLLRRDVAVKEVRLPIDVREADRPALREHLLREAQAAARLNHPGATTVYDVVEEGGGAYIVMELVRAPSLLQVVQDRGPCDPGLAARIGLALLEALEAAHAVGLVHCDVKPGNVLITPDGGVKLTDFGIASVLGDPLFTTGAVLGSPAFMAPEQARGDRLTEAVDVWSLGATLYFAVEGVPPFQRGQTMPTLAALLEEEPRAPQRAGALEPAIEAALVKDRSRRATLTELRSLLEPVAAPASYGPVQTGGNDESDETSLRDLAGRAAKELVPAVSSLLARHETRYPAPQRQPEEPRKPPAPMALTLQGVGERLRLLWRVAKLVLVALVIAAVALIGYAAYELFE